MIIIKFQGGLGNQMFQYAMYYKYQKMGLEVKADLLYYLSNEGVMPFKLTEYFPEIELEVCTSEEIQSEKFTNPERHTSLKILDGLLYVVFPNKKYYVYEIQEGKYLKYFEKIKCGYLEGFWQSEKYFLQYADELRYKFSFPKEEIKEIIDVSNWIRNENFISLHVRKGDYTQKKNQLLFGNICTKEYYARAMEYIQKKVSNARFLVFSDDLDTACKELDIPDAVYVDKSRFHLYKDWYDLYFMSLCKHNIIANSTFSWWGAWLNQSEGRMVIAPNRWINNRKTPDIWGQDWIKI